MSNCSQETNKPIFELDHFNIWVQHPQEAKDKLVELGFTAIPDSLSLIHRGQGTTGRYFYFLNTYLEFIYINDSTEFHNNNLRNNELDFLERSKNAINGYSPFSLCLRMNDYNKDNIPFDVIEYYQDWMEDGTRIYSAKNSKLNKKEPSIFVMFPEGEYGPFEKMEDLKSIPEEYAIWREFYKHKNGVEKVTRIEIYSNFTPNSNSKSLKAIKEIDNLELLSGKEYVMEVYFDNNKQNKRIDLRPEIPLILNW